MDYPTVHRHKIKLTSKREMSDRMVMALKLICKELDINYTDAEAIEADIKVFSIR